MEGIMASPSQIVDAIFIRNYLALATESQRLSNEARWMLTEKPKGSLAALLPAHSVPEHITVLRDKALDGDKVAYNSLIESEPFKSWQKDVGDASRSQKELAEFFSTAARERMKENRVCWIKTKSDFAKNTLS